MNRKSKNGYLEIVETLIDAGANTELKNEDGDTPLMLAVRSEHSAVVDAMCKRGCDLHTPGFDNLEPIDYAKTKKNLYLSDMLSKHEARILKNNSITEHEEEIYDAPPIVATPSVIHWHINEHNWKKHKNTLNTRFVPHGATLKIRKTAPHFKLDDQNLTLSGESPFQVVLEPVKNMTF